MIKVLHVYPKLSNAGTEMVIMNLYRNIDRTKVQFDFLVQDNGELDSAVRELGATVHRVPQGKNYYQDIDCFFKNHPEYRIVHTHMHAEMGEILKIAHKNGVPVRIAHSHNYRGDLPKIAKLYKIVTSWNIENHATHLVACSQEAAEWLFPRKFKKAVVWNNAISLERFLYDEKARTEYREKLEIPNDAKVICHVGRFAKQKNHERIISILNKMIREDKNVYGVLVGVGPLLDEMKNKAGSSRILFLGNRTDVPGILCASDAFLFPSLYEGLGIVAVEAQASGLVCIASQNVPKAADIATGVFKQVNLCESDDVWIDALNNAMDQPNREQHSVASLRSQYNIQIVVSEVQDFYLKCATENDQKIML